MQFSFLESFSIYTVKHASNLISVIMTYIKKLYPGLVDPEL